MGTQLIMTVGTNPLPVWVAWYHLRNVLEQPVKVRFVHTAGTVNEKERLEKYCNPMDTLAHISTSPGTPGKVRDDIEVILNDEITDLHVHYTGGTKVMSVETVAALEYNLPDNVNLYTSYLDPRGISGPVIVDSEGVSLGPDDARKNIDPDLQKIANLNGFTLAPFTHEYWDNDARQNAKKDIPEPVILDQNQENAGRVVLGRIGTRARGRIDPTDFEYAAYVALKKALTKIETRNPIRNNYQLFNKVHVRRTRAAQQAAHFELDVVAVLGYQVVVVSCSLETGAAPVKEKGMEVILRARQLGGDEAHAIVLCNARPNTAQRVEQELHDEVGSAGTPLQVWGTDKWRNLSDLFYNYLRDDLHWM